MDESPSVSLDDKVDKPDDSNQDGPAVGADQPTQEVDPAATAAQLETSPSATIQPSNTTSATAQLERADQNDGALAISPGATAAEDAAKDAAE